MTFRERNVSWTLLCKLLARPDLGGKVSLLMMEEGASKKKAARLAESAPDPRPDTGGSGPLRPALEKNELAVKAERCDEASSHSE